MISLRRLLAAALLPIFIALLPTTAAGAPAPAPHWTIMTQAAPADFHPGDTTDIYEVTALNDGNAAAAPNETITDVLPEGLTVTSVIGRGHFTFFDTPYFECESKVVGSTPIVTCTDPEGAPAGAELNVKIDVEVPADASGTLSNLATISGGGAQEATWSTSTPVTPADQPVPYGATAVTDVVAADGSEASQAGSHPFGLTTLLGFNAGGVAAAEECEETPGCMQPAGNTENVEVELPPGILGNPNAVPTCSQARFSQQTNEGCPADTQVGFVFLRFYGGAFANQVAPVYNIEPPAGQPGEFGFSVAGVAHIPMFFHLRSDGDYGLTANLNRISEYATPRFSALTIWGVPADPIHDVLRASEGGCEFGCASDVQPAPLLTMPTSCSGTPLSIPLFTNSWQEPGVNAPAQPSVLSPMSGCNQLEFEPTLQARPTTNVADSPSGLHVDIHVPQPESPEGLAEAHLKDAVVTLPKGLTLNPSSAAGLEGCTPAQFGLTSAEGTTPIRTTADPAECPDASKLGTVEIDSPLLREHDETGHATGFHALAGSVYLATPHDNPFNSLLALYIGVSDPKTGVVIKLAGKVSIGEDGQLTTTFAENPQLPFEDFKLDFFGGARAPLRTPAVCGEYKTTSELTPWSAPESGPAATPSDPYLIASGPNGHPCATNEAALPNAPGFEAGTESPTAGAYSPFSLHLHREDGSQVLRALNVDLPEGLLGRLAGVAECSDAALAAAAQKTGAAEQASPSCPPGSRIGTVEVGAGAGPAPYYTSGTAYLAGPYKGDPLSVAIITPAVAGPFDLGTVVVRNALHVDPFTSQVSVTSDPIPTQLQGIQLDIRSIDLKLDRDQFTLNPTSCEKMAIGGQEISTLANSAALSNPFQVGGCAKLGFKPKLRISLKGATRRAGHPALKAVLTYPKKGAYANIARAQVSLPHSEFLDQGSIGTVCTQPQLASRSCPAGSVYGHARAWSPLLDKPLEGPVYLGVGFGHQLPDLVAELNGQIRVLLHARIDTDKKDGLRSTFEAVPDAPVSKFVLEMQGGPKKGLLENHVNICTRTHRAEAAFTAQSGRVADLRPRILEGCGRRKGKSHK
jgi:uncharacterized repeat protein (TIGR01451 family)